jgi:hypothetical protein
MLTMQAEIHMSRDEYEAAIDVFHAGDRGAGATE